MIAPGPLLTPSVASASTLSAKRLLAQVRDQLTRYAADQPLRSAAGKKDF